MQAVVSRTTAKYFERAKRLVVFGPTWTLTARASSRGNLSSVLSQHGLKRRSGQRWSKVGRVYYVEVARR